MPFPAYAIYLELADFIVLAVNESGNLNRKGIGSDICSPLIASVLLLSKINAQTLKSNCNLMPCLNIHTCLQIYLRASKRQKTQENFIKVTFSY